MYFSDARNRGPYVSLFQFELVFLSISTFSLFASLLITNSIKLDHKCAMAIEKINISLERAKKYCTRSIYAFVNKFWHYRSTVFLYYTNCHEIQVLFKIRPLIRWIGQNKFWQKWDSSTGYPALFPSAITITPLSQMCLWRALNYGYFMHH